MPPTKLLPVASPAPQTLNKEWWVLLAALPLFTVVLTVGLSTGPTPQPLVGALGVRCYAATLAFDLGLCARVAARQSPSQGSFAVRFLKACGLCLVAMLFFVLAVFLSSDSASAAPNSYDNNPGLFEGINGAGCVALAGVFGPILLVF